MKGRRSEKEFLLGYDECSPSMYSNNRNVPHEHVRGKETQNI